MGTMRVYKADGTMFEEPCDGIYEGQKAMRSRLMEIIGGYVEHVRVIFDGKIMALIVNEEGALMEPPLPVNETATKIYHTNVAIMSGRTFNEMRRNGPLIYGDAVLLLDCEVR